MEKNEKNAPSVKLNDSTSCCICLCEVDDISQAKMESCCHIFHIDCIIAWGKRVNLCPLCKIEFHTIIFQGKNITVEKEDDDTESNRTSEFDGDDDYDYDDEDGDDLDFDSNDEEEDCEICDICEEECTLDGESFTSCRGNCGRSVHFSCRGLSSGETWYCVECQPRRRVVRARLPSTTRNSDRTQSVSSSLSWAEESISRQLQNMRQKMERAANSFTEPSQLTPLHTPETTNSALRLRSKSKLATEIGREIMNDVSRLSTSSPSSSTTDVKYKRIRRNSTESSRLSQSENILPFPTSTTTSIPTPTRTTTPTATTNQLTLKAQNSRKNLDSTSVNDLLARFTTQPAREKSPLSSSLSSSSSTISTISPPSFSHSSTYTATTSQLPVTIQKLKPISYSTTQPVDNAFLWSQQQQEQRRQQQQQLPPSTALSLHELIEQYLSQLQSPLLIHDNQLKREKLAGMVPKIFSLCILRTNKDFLVGILDRGLLSILSRYLSEDSTASSSSSSSSSSLRLNLTTHNGRTHDRQCFLSFSMQEMILRAIHCLPVKPRHLFHLKIMEQNDGKKIKIGKFNSLIHILSRYLVNRDRILERSGGGAVAAAALLDTATGVSLANISRLILNDWRNILKHYPSAMEKLEILLKEGEGGRESNEESDQERQRRKEKKETKKEEGLNG